MARMLTVEEEAIKKSQQQQRTTMAVPNVASKSSSIRLFSLGLFFLFYLVLGASIFSAIESPIEKQAMEGLRTKKAQFLQTYPCITESALDDMIEDIIEANNRGVSIDRNGTGVPSWSFGQSFFFSSTVVTTIGYGHQSPLSGEGKFFCILYAMIGIPMTMLLVTAVVDRLMVPVNLLLIWINNTMGHRYEPFTLRIFHLLLILLLILVCMFLIPAAIFAALESKWGYLDSMYYCFISLTTVGLGDFIPGDTPGQQLRPLYKACTTIYLLLGVTAMMLLLTVFYSIPEFDISTFFLLSCSSGKLNGIGNVNNIESEAVVQPNYSERMRLKTPGSTGPNYTQQVNNELQPSSSRTYVRARSRPDDDSPSDDAGPSRLK